MYIETSFLHKILNKSNHNENRKPKMLHSPGSKNFYIIFIIDIHLVFIWWYTLKKHVDVMSGLESFLMNFNKGAKNSPWRTWKKRMMRWKKTWLLRCSADIIKPLDKITTTATRRSPSIIGSKSFSVHRRRNAAKRLENSHSRSLHFYNYRQGK